MEQQATASTWLVTGAEGFLGANLGHVLGAIHGPEIRRVGVTRAGRPSLQFDRMLACDLTDPRALCAFIRQQRPEVVVHAAALSSHERCAADPELAERINVRSSGELARACQQAGSRFVLISTDAVFDGMRGHYREGDEPSPFSAYGWTKLRAEVQSLESPDALVLRTNFFGWSPSGRRSILEFFVNALATGAQVRGFTDFTVSSGYAQAICTDLVDLVRAGATGVVHLASSDALSKYEFGLAVAAEFGFDQGLIFPASADVDPPRNRDLSLDVTKATRILGRPLLTQGAGIAQARADDRSLRQALTRSGRPGAEQG